MKIDGSHTFNADRQAVWDALMDPDVLAGCIPGCQRLDLVSEDTYEVELKIGVGAIRGSYKGRIGLTDKIAQESYRMVVDGRGIGGSAKGAADLRLVESNGVTDVRVEGDAEITGILARVGQRLLGSTSKMLMNQFFECIRSEIEGP